MSVKEIEFQNFQEHMIDNPLLNLSKTLTEKNIAIKNLKDPILKYDFESIKLSSELDMKKAKKYQDRFFECLKNYDKYIENISNKNEREKEILVNKSLSYQKECMSVYKKFCDKYNNGWKKYQEMQLIFLKMYGELQSREWLDTDG